MTYDKSFGAAWTSRAEAIIRDGPLTPADKASIAFCALLGTLFLARFLKDLYTSLSRKDFDESTGIPPRIAILLASVQLSVHYVLRALYVSSRLRRPFTLHGVAHQLTMYAVMNFTGQMSDIFVASGIVAYLYQTSRVVPPSGMPGSYPKEVSPQESPRKTRVALAVAAATILLVWMAFAISYTSLEATRIQSSNPDLGRRVAPILFHLSVAFYTVVTCSIAVASWVSWKRSSSITTPYTKPLYILSHVLSPLLLFRALFTIVLDVLNFVQLDRPRLINQSALFLSNTTIRGIIYLIVVFWFSSFLFSTKRVPSS